MSSQRTEDYLRARTGSLASGPFGTPNSRGSADGMAQSTEHAFPDASFSASLHDMIPMDLSSRATPDSTSTGSSHRHAFSAQPYGAQGTHNPVNKLDSLMFPSEDPFAYPNQPMMELGFQPKAEGPAVTLAAPQHDPSFFFAGSLDDVGDQLLGQPPPYMVQHQTQQHLGLGGNPYDPHNMMAMHTAPPPPQQAQRPPVQHQSSGGFFSGFRRARADRQQERQIEQMFTQQGMQPDWGSFFGSGRGGFQGM